MTSFKQTVVVLLLILFYASLFRLGFSLNCYACECTDCKLHRDELCLFPFRYNATIFAHRYETRVRRFEVLRRDQRNAHFCYVLSYDQRVDKSYIKVVKRYVAKTDDNGCQRARNQTNFKNVVCENCSTNYCNENQIHLPTLCYSCECTNCDMSKDSNCLMPDERETPKVFALQNETFQEPCVIISWVNNKEKYVKRTAQSDLAICQEKRRDPLRFTNLICTTCNDPLCNNLVIETTKIVTCYECKCEDCNQTIHRNCLLPNKKITPISRPLADEREFCFMLAAIHEKDNVLLVERNGTCQAPTCKHRMQELSTMGFTKLECVLCRRNLCNNNKKYNLLKFLNPEDADEEDLFAESEKETR